jgi:hypothetical protein
VRCCAFSPDGWQLAAGGEDGWLTIWDVAGPTPQLLLARPEFGGAVLGVAYRPGGGGELACCSREGIGWLKDYSLLREDQQGVRVPVALAGLQGPAAAAAAPGAADGALAGGGRRQAGLAGVQLAGAVLGCCVVPAAGGGEAALALALPEATALWDLWDLSGRGGGGLQQWPARSRLLRLSLSQPAEQRGSSSGASGAVCPATAQCPGLASGDVELGQASGGCGAAALDLEPFVLHTVPGTLRCCALSSSHAAVAWDDGTVAVLRTPSWEGEPQALGTALLGGGDEGGEGGGGAGGSSCWRQEGAACRFDGMAVIAAVALSPARGYLAVCCRGGGPRAGEVVLHQYGGCGARQGRGQAAAHQQSRARSLLVPNPEGAQPLCVAFDQDSDLLVSAPAPAATTMQVPMHVHLLPSRAAIAPPTPDP